MDTKIKSKAYSYVRVSSEAQAERGTSIQSQLELIRKYAKQNSISIVKEFVDEAESATTDLRPDFQEMISLCKADAHGVDSILVWKLSRFARNKVDSVVYKKLLKDRQGIRVISVSEPIEDTPEGRMLEGIIEVMDSYYSENLAKESMRGLRQAAKQGFHTGGVTPYGYRLKNVNVGNTIKKVWEIHPKESKAVKLIYTMHSKGHTYKEIMDALYEKGFKPRKKNEWGKSSISEILRKQCYSGTHYFNTRKRKDLGKRVHLRDIKDKSEWISIKVPQIVDDDTFKTVKEKIGKRKFKTPRRKANQILSGLLVCGLCEQPYVIGDYYRGKYPYYRCSTKMKQGKSVCSNRTLRGDELDKVILAEIKDKIFSEQNLKQYKKLLDESVSDEKVELQETIKALEKEKEELNNKKKVYYEGLETGKLNMDLVSERLEQLKAEDERITKQKLESEERLTNLPEAENYELTKKEYQELRESLSLFIDEGTTQQKRLFLSNFIQSITVHPDKIVIEYTPPILSNKKSPHDDGGGNSVIGVASPRGFEPLSPA